MLSCLVCASTDYVLFDYIMHTVTYVRAPDNVFSGMLNPTHSLR